MENKIVKTEFEITTTSTGKIIAKVGDVLKVKNKDAEHYYILKLNDKPIFSRWIRKTWVDYKCN